MRLQRRRFSEPSDVWTIPRGRIDVVELDDTVVGRMTYEPGWRWSVDVRPIAGTDTCPYHHLWSCSQGACASRGDGTALEIGPGDVFEIPLGHDAWVVGTSPGLRSTSRRCGPTGSRQISALHDSGIDRLHRHGRFDSTCNQPLMPRAGIGPGDPCRGPHRRGPDGHAEGPSRARQLYRLATV